MPSPGRPHNPFTPTGQLDRETSRTPARQIHALKYDKLKDQYAHGLSPFTDRGQSLPFSKGSDSLSGAANLRSSVSEKFNSSSAAITSSMVAGRTAPPIPKKPAFLSNRQYAQESMMKEERVPTLPIPPSQGYFISDKGPKTQLISPPQRVRQREIYRQQATESSRSFSQQRATGIINPVLMDAEIEGASAIPSLQPMRRQDSA